MSCWQKAQTTAVFVALFSLVSTAHSDETRYEVALKANVLLGDGVPTSDIMGLGVVGHYNIRGGWFAGATLDTCDYDFERPSLILGIAQDALSRILTHRPAKLCSAVLWADTMGKCL